MPLMLRHHPRVTPYRTSTPRILSVDIRCNHRLLMWQCFYFQLLLNFLYHMHPCLVGIGDSITAGVHSEGGNMTYPAQLQTMLDTKYPGKYKVTNLGACGSTMMKGILLKYS